MACFRYTHWIGLDWIGLNKKVVYSVLATGRLTAQLACRQYYSNCTVNSCFKCMQQTTLTEWCCDLTVALRLATSVTRGSNPSLYHIFWFIFQKVFTRLGIRLGLVFLGLGIVLVYLAYDTIVLLAG